MQSFEINCLIVVVVKIFGEDELDFFVVEAVVRTLDGGEKIMLDLHITLPFTLEATITQYTSMKGIKIS